MPSAQLGIVLGSRGSIVLVPSALAPQVTIRPQDRDLRPWMPAPGLRTLEI